MAEKEIQWLKNQIEKLNLPGFDLHIWKNSTLMVLDKIFGRDSDKTVLIKNLNYDYGSWTLRDTTGASPTETVKRLGKEILETAIQELELFGLPEHKESSIMSLSVIQSALEESLRISQYRELISIIKEQSDPSDRKNKLNEKLQSYGDETVRSVLAAILAHPEMESLK